MKNILLLSREFPPSLGGAGIAVYNYIKNIKSYKFFVVTFFDPTFADEHIIIKKIKFPLFGHRYINAFHYIASSILKSFGDYDCTIGNAFIGSACGVIIKKLTGKPLISIIHDVDYLYSPSCKYSRVNKFIRKKMFNSIFSDSDAIIIPNKVIKEDIRRIFGGDVLKKVSVITLGVDVEPFEKMSKPKEKKIILFVGAVRSNKGIEYLIEAFKTVVEEFANSELWVVGSIGDKEYYEMLRKLVAQLKIKDKVKFLGPVKHYDKKNVVGYKDISQIKDKDKIKGLGQNIFSYYDVCDIFAIASYHSERFGIPCVEASLMGKPIVATDIFEENGVVVDKKTAIVVPKKDSKALANALIKLLRDKKLRMKLGGQAKEYARRFETTNLSKEFEAIIKDLIG